MNIRYPLYEGVYRILTFKNGKKKGVVPGNVGFITLACTTLFYDFVWMKDRSGFGEMGTFFLPIMMRFLFRYRG